MSLHIFSKQTKIDFVGMRHYAYGLSALLILVGLITIFMNGGLRYGVDFAGGAAVFPGGRVEAEDASPQATALREAWEEIGLAPERVDVLGYLPDYRTGTGYRITPVVGRIALPIELRPDPREVAEAFEVPLAFLLDPINHREYEREYMGRMRRYCAMTYADRFIWGATAGIIVALAQVLNQGLETRA